MCLCLQSPCQSIKTNWSPVTTGFARFDVILNLRKGANNHSTAHGSLITEMAIAVLFLFSSQLVTAVVKKSIPLGLGDLISSMGFKLIIAFHRRRFYHQYNSKSTAVREASLEYVHFRIQHLSLFLLLV